MTKIMTKIMTKFITNLREESKNTLLQILLHDKYELYKKGVLLDNNTTEEKYCIKRSLLSFEEWIKFILENY